MPRRLSVGDLKSVLPERGHIFVSSCSSESELLTDEFEAAGSTLEGSIISGIFVPGLNRSPTGGNSTVDIITFFQSPELADGDGKVTFLPLCYQDIQRWYAANPPDAVAVMLSLPDQDGNCSFGVDPGFGADLWRKAPIRVAHLNPAMPRTAGDRGIPFSELDAFFEHEAPLLTMPATPIDADSRRIARFAAEFIGDGATVQTGLGKLPDAVLDALHDRQGLRVHSGLVGDGAGRLARSGALAKDGAAVVGCAIGSTDFYEQVADSCFEFRPVSTTHGPAALAAIERLVTVNSVFAVDLFGQGFAEALPQGFVSGPGGASDFARGARAAAGGLRIIVLPSSSGGNSRILPPGEGPGPVSLSRFDIDVVVTEHGAADLRLLDHDNKAKALIGIAAPEFRDNLRCDWSQFPKP